MKVLPVVELVERAAVNTRFKTLSSFVPSTNLQALSVIGLKLWDPLAVKVLSKKLIWNSYQLILSLRIRAFNPFVEVNKDDTVSLYSHYHYKPLWTILSVEDNAEFAACLTLLNAGFLVNSILWFEFHSRQGAVEDASRWSLNDSQLVKGLQIILDGCIGGKSVTSRLRFNLNRDTKSSDKTPANLETHLSDTVLSNALSLNRYCQTQMPSSVPHNWETHFPDRFFCCYFLVLSFPISSCSIR